ncbi:ABC transporter permease [Candidatus Woesearchaeota archaeon]|nr:ABC transporter permease [Candidatus Woesearchaeota archaeon]
MLLGYIRIAWKNLTHRSLRSWLTLLGILIGVAAVVSLIGLGEGLKAAVSSQFGISATEVITVQAGGISGLGPPGTAVSDPLVLADVDEIEKLSSVELAISRIIEQVQVEYNDIFNFGSTISMPAGDERDFAEDALEIEAEFGRLLKDGDNKKVVLGHNFYIDKAGFGKPITEGRTISIDGQKFEVVGILKKKGSFIFDNVILINENVLRDLTGNKDEVDVIAVKVKSKELMDKAKDDIERLMRKRRDVKEGEENFEVQTPDAALSTVGNVLSGVQIFVGMIALISVLVGALGIVNTMTTAVLERRKQIGVMKAIGARNSDIFYQFLIESGIMGLIGGIVGATIGSAISYVGTLGINNFIGSEITPSLNISLVLLTLLGTFLVGCLAGIIPAMNAARQKPVDALRG